MISPCVLVPLALAVVSQAAPPAAPVEIADSVVMLQNDRLLGSNITCFVLPEGLVFVDAGLFTDVAAQFRKEMEARFGRKTLALLLSHAHTDHFFGMGAFSDVPVVAAAAARESFRRQLAVDWHTRVEAYKRIFPRFEEALETARPFMPTVWFESEIQFGAGPMQVLFRRTGGHSAGSSYAFAPHAGVIATGDNLQVDAYPYFGDPSGDMSLWIQALIRWESLGGNAFCPGHGRTVDLAYLTSTRIFFQDMVLALDALKKKAIPVDEAVVHPSLPEGYWKTDAPEPPWYRPAIAGLYGRE